jgi:hypothetical protein
VRNLTERAVPCDLTLRKMAGTSWKKFETLTSLMVDPQVTGERQQRSASDVGRRSWRTASLL